MPVVAGRLVYFSSVTNLSYMIRSPTPLQLIIFRLQFLFYCVRLEFRFTRLLLIGFINHLSRFPSGVHKNGVVCLGRSLSLSCPVCIWSSLAVLKFTQRIRISNWIKTNFTTGSIPYLHYNLSALIKFRSLPVAIFSLVFRVCPDT